MDNPFYAFPIGFGAIFRSDPDLEEYFFKLPEETQQELIDEDIHSARDLRDCIERYKQKE